MNKKRFALLMISLFIMPIVAVGVSVLTDAFDVKELPIYGRIPEFLLTERDGSEFGSKELQGKVWVANFIFTTCSGQCPLVNSKMQSIQNKLRFKDKLRLVSFTVDPKRDTPEVLTEYARKFDADPFKWKFLTGEPKSLFALIQNGFRLSSGGVEEITHSFQFVLVDSNGRIRGYYDGLEEGVAKRIIKDAKGLLKQAF